MVLTCRGIDVCKLMSEQEEDIFFDVDTSFREEEEVLAVGDGTDDEREPAQNLNPNEELQLPLPPGNNDADAPVDDEEDDIMAQAGNAVKPRIQVPMFDPEAKGANAAAWLRSVEYCRQAAGKNANNAFNWSEDVTIGVAKIALQGKALLWINYVSQHNPEYIDTWAHFKENFKKRFHLSPTYGEKAALIAELRQTTEESALDFYDRVGASMDAIFDNYTPAAGTDINTVKQNTINEIQGAIFCNGLRDGIKPFVVNQSLETLTDLKNAAQRVEANLDRRQKHARKEHLVMPITEEEISAIRKTLANQKKGKRFEGNCNYCKKYGHMVRDCFLKRNNENRAKGGNQPHPKKGGQVAGIDSQANTSSDHENLDDSDVNALDVSSALNALLA